MNFQLKLTFLISDYTILIFKIIYELESGALQVQLEVPLLDFRWGWRSTHTTEAETQLSPN